MTRVWLYLVGLTLAEVALAFVHLPTTVMVASLLVLSVTKTVLIAWHFMHLRTAKPPQFHYLLPFLLVCVAALLALLPDGPRP